MNNTIDNVQPHSAAKISGITLSILQGINTTGVLNAVLCTAIGTVVSFMISMALKKIFGNNEK